MSRQKFDITKVKHNEYLYRCILETGLTLKGFCELIGISEATMLGLLRFKKSPLDGWASDYSKICKIIAEGLGLSCEELFPFELYGLERLDLLVEFTYYQVIMESGNHLIGNVTPFDETSSNELGHCVLLVLRSLTPRQERVIRDRFGIQAVELTIAELAESFELTTSKIRIIEEEAIYRLRHSSRARYLEDFC